MKRVLIVDDEPEVLKLASLVFETHLWHIRVASTGEQALRMFAEERPHLVVLDLGLPGIDGLAVLSEMRALSKSVPVVIITGKLDASYMRPAMNLGVQQYLVKPSIYEGLERVALAYGS